MCLAIVLPVGERPGPAAVRITRDWYAPVGGVLMAGAGFFAMLGFPLDDVWHRLFGQDVTLWGRGGTLFAVGFYVFVRGGVGAIVGPFLGEPFPSIPLYLAEALCVELAALLLARRSLALGAVSGLLIGTAGFAAEYAWTQVAVLGAAMANGLVATVPDGVRAEITLTEVASPGPVRTAQAVVRIIPAAAVDRPSWLTITSWLAVGHRVGSRAGLRADARAGAGLGRVSGVPGLAGSRPFDRWAGPAGGGSAVMTGEVVLAHHAIIAAVPFLVPMLVITLMMVAIAVQDRRRGPDP